MAQVNNLENSHGDGKNSAPRRNHAVGLNERFGQERRKTVAEAIQMAELASKHGQRSRTVTST